MTAPGAPARPRRAGTVAALGLAVVAAVVAATLFAGPGALDRARQGSAVRGDDGVQELTVTVANGVYTPNVLRAKAQEPLRLRVEVRERHSCSTKLLVPDLGLDFDLPPGGRIDLLLPASPPGAHLFTCGQKMVKGSLVFE